MVYAPPPRDNARRLAALPPARRKAARALLDVLRHRAGLDLAVELEPSAYIALESRGIGPLAADRAVLDLLACGLAEAAPGIAPIVTIQTAEGGMG
jgi:hypothetical protein